MPNKKIENEEVLKPCLILCRQLQDHGAILQYRRLDTFDHSHIDGSPDIEIWFAKDNMLWILMAECKKPVGGVWSSKQKDYKKRHEGLINVIYELIISKTQLFDLIEKLTGYFEKKIEEIKF